MDNQDDNEDYIAKAKQIFTYINEFRQNPKSLAKKLEYLRTYLDYDSNILSEPNKIQIQMVEGDSVFKEAISYLKKLQPLPPLEWDNNLAQSAMEHVMDIGPKGLLLYQSSDGTEPEDRISKYGNYKESLGENIDFGPNDAMGVIISLTLDDGEEQRPHRENLFKSDYHKVGIACGRHKTEFQMTVMDFAYDFTPLDENEGNNKNVNKNNNNFGGEMKLNIKPGDMLNNSNYGNNNNNLNINNNNDVNAPNVINNQSPLVKLSLETDDFTKMIGRNNYNNNNNNNMMNNNNNNNLNNNNLNNNNLNNNNNKNINININNNNNVNNEIEELSNETKNILNRMKIISKKVEIVTKIIYTYEDGSTKEVSSTQNHVFNY
jgi:hypothetical protein